MPSQHAFGRRGAPAVPFPKEQPAWPALPAPNAIHPPLAPPPARDPEDNEPRRRFPIPWRQISLMASLCFGIASLVLPDTVNDDVQWLLYALAGLASFRPAAGRPLPHPGS